MQKTLLWQTYKTKADNIACDIIDQHMCCALDYSANKMIYQRYIALSLWCHVHDNWKLIECYVSIILTSFQKENVISNYFYWYYVAIQHHILGSQFSLCWVWIHIKTLSHYCWRQYLFSISCYKSMCLLFCTLSLNAGWQGNCNLCFQLGQPENWR